MRVWLCLLLLGCGARVGLPVEERDAAMPDAPIDVPVAVDAPAPDTPPPVTCRAERGFGGFSGFVPVFDIEFPYVVGGVEGFGAHSCPRLFIRAGDTPTFDGAFLEIEVPYFGEDGFAPGMREASLTVYPEGRFTAEPWFEMIFVDVIRADGLEPTMTPPEEWSATVLVDYHDATTDLVGGLDMAPYCNDFAICI